MQRKFVHLVQSLSAAALLIGVTVVGAQEPASSPIEIIDQNGKPVKSVDVQSGTATAQTGAKAQAKADFGAEAQAGGNGIVITDGQGPQSIIVNRGTKTVVIDGEKKTQSFGKAVIIGPDGKRQEIELGGPDGGGGVFELPGFNGTARANRVSNRFMIGVNCNGVGATLASQLRLEPGTGLVVQTLAKDSPAEKAGIEKHDILMFAEDKQLSSLKDLQEVVEVAGKENSKISFTLIRGGKEVGVTVTPVERPEGPAWGGPGIAPGLIRVFKDLDDFDLELKQALPGMMVPNFPANFPPGGVLPAPPALTVPKDFHKEMKAEMDEMRKQMEALSKQMENRLNNNK